MPVSLKAGVVAAVRGLVDDDTLDAVAGDLTTAYVDERRPLDAATADIVYDHDDRLAVALQRRLNRDAPPVVVDATAQLLHAVRGTTTALVSDLRVVARHSDDGADDRSMAQAERFMDSGMDS